ncbi:MAG: fluoride efflux transporter CrcB [Bradymonadales bacterium]|jgi:CrcB protein
MGAFLWVCAGSALGGGARYLLTRLMLQEASAFSWAVFSANILGCFLIGAFTACFIKFELANEFRLFLSLGLLGGFTTFSSFSLEALQLLKTQAYGHAIFYVFASTIFGIAACAIAFCLFSRIFSLTA